MHLQTASVSLSSKLESVTTCSACSLLSDLTTRGVTSDPALRARTVNQSITASSTLSRNNTAKTISTCFKNFSLALHLKM